jgi:hypothetical protein
MNKKVVFINLVVLIVLVIGVDIFLTLTMPNRRAWGNGDPDIGFTTSPIVVGDGRGKRILMIGDSHSEPTRPMAIHQAAMLQAHLDSAGIRNAVILFGRPQLNPTQAFIVIEKLREVYNPDLVIYNLYGGNDFAEMLRNDDRPRLDTAQGRIIFQKPRWYWYRPPGWKPRWPQDSKIFSFLNAVTSNSNYLVKMTTAPVSIELLTQSWLDKMKYVFWLNDMKDDRLGYTGAVAAQYLNQGMLQHRFNAAFTSQVDFRLRLMDSLVKKSDIPIMFSWIPSAAGCGAVPEADRSIHEERITKMGLNDSILIAQEESIKASFRNTVRHSASFVDITDEYRQVKKERKVELYDKETIHIQGLARELLAKKIADSCLSILKR